MTDTITNIEAIAERLKKATPGPWRYDPDDEGSTMGWVVQIHPVYEQLGNSLFAVCGDSGQQADNAEFVASAPADIAFLLSALAERDATIAVMREALSDWWAQANGNWAKKSCGHNFECICIGHKVKSALSNLPERAKAIVAVVEAAKAVKFAAYPAHGSGFVTIVGPGGGIALEAALSALKDNAG